MSFHPGTRKPRACGAGVVKLLSVKVARKRRWAGAMLHESSIYSQLRRGLSLEELAEVAGCNLFLLSMPIVFRVGRHPSVNQELPNYIRGYRSRSATALGLKLRPFPASTKRVVNLHKR